jgi:hypothetical protein
MRAGTSEPPGAKGTISRTGRVGYADLDPCASGADLAAAQTFAPHTAHNAITPAAAAHATVRLRNALYSLCNVIRIFEKTFGRYRKVSLLE